MFFRKSKTTGNDNAPVPAAPTYIGRSTTFEGVLITDGELHIDGLVRGSVRAKLCVVDSNGIIEGEAEADEIVVRGRVTGPLRGQHVQLEDGAQVEGDISSETIAVDSGARLQGTVWQTGDALAASTAPRSDSHNLFASPLWNGVDDGSFRPLKAIRPR